MKGKYNMKKIFALFLVIILMASVSVTAFAADNTVNYNGNQNPQTSGLNVTYNVQPNFTVTIPENVTLGSNVTVSTDKVVVEYGKAVKVKLTGTGEDDNTFKLKTEEGAVLEYTVKMGDRVVNVGDTVLTVAPDSTATSAQLSFVMPTNVTYAGNYTGTVTFSIVVE